MNHLAESAQNDDHPESKVSGIINVVFLVFLFNILSVLSNDVTKSVSRDLNSELEKSKHFAVSRQLDANR